MPIPPWPLGIGANTDYNVIITVLADGVSFTMTNTAFGPLDALDDYLIGVKNSSGATIYAVTFVRVLMFYGDAVWAFDDTASVPDGPYVPFSGTPDSPQNCGTPGPPQGILPSGYIRTGYEGPDNYFGPLVPFNDNFGAPGSAFITVNFPGGIPPGGESYFGTEEYIIAGYDEAAISITSTPGAECAFAEDEDDTPQDPITWPECDLVATRISVKANSPTVSPGRSFTSLERVIQPDAGSWEIELQDIPIRSLADVLRWRDIESGLNGRANNILVPVYEGKLSPTPIAATANADVAIGAVIVAVNKTAGAALQPGMQFSDLVGRLYRIKSIVSVAGNINTVKAWPPIRTPITAGDALEFNKPVCRCRLASDDGMNAMLELLTFARQSVRFLEDV